MQGQSDYFDTNALCQLPGLRRAQKSHKLCGLVLEYSNIMLYYQMEVKSLVKLVLLIQLIMCVLYF